MSADKSNMPRGTRQAALIALCLAACLLAWRAHTLLTQDAAPPASTPPEIHSLQNVLEPVLGEGTFRIAGHAGHDGAWRILLLVDTERAGTRLDQVTRDQVQSIVTAATGFDPSRDTFRIQPLTFAPGTNGRLQRADYIELLMLASLCMLTGFLAVMPGRTLRQASAPARPRRDDTPAAHPYLHAVPMEPSGGAANDHDEARRLARENPQETARILRGWMNDGGQG